MNKFPSVGFAATPVGKGCGGHWWGSLNTHVSGKEGSSSSNLISANQKGILKGGFKRKDNERRQRRPVEPRKKGVIFI